MGEARWQSRNERRVRPYGLRDTFIFSVGSTRKVKALTGKMELRLAEAAKNDIP